MGAYKPPPSCTASEKTFRVLFVPSVWFVWFVCTLRPTINREEAEAMRQPCGRTPRYSHVGIKSVLARIIPQQLSDLLILLSDLHLHSSSETNSEANNKVDLYCSSLQGNAQWYTPAGSTAGSKRTTAGKRNFPTTHASGKPTRRTKV